MSNVITSVPKINFEGNLVLMSLASVFFWHFPTLKVTFRHRDVYYAKKMLNNFV